MKLVSKLVGFCEKKQLCLKRLTCRNAAGFFFNFLFACCFGVRIGVLNIDEVNWNRNLL